MADRRILVVANLTCPCPALADEVASRAGATPAELLVVAPALNARLRHWLSDVDEAIAGARERLNRAIANLSERGIAAHGIVGDSDPLIAIEDALAGFAATEVIVSTHPPDRSNWLEKNLPERASRRFGLPLTHLVSRYGVEPAEARGVVTVRPHGRQPGRQGLEYAWCISAESVGAHGLCAHVVRIPPGGRARAHLHAGHETAIYMLAGTAVTWFGEGLRERVINTTGDLIYIPPGCPHLPVNQSASEEAVALVARTDPNEQESVVLLPELDGLPHTYQADPLVA